MIRKLACSLTLEPRNLVPTLEIHREFPKGNLDRKLSSGQTSFIKLSTFYTDISQIVWPTWCQ